MSAMLKSVSRAMFMAACAWGVALPAALGQDVVSLAYLQGKLPVATDAMATLGPDLFGDRINLFNGSFSFEQTDLELPGNSALPVALVRQHTPGRSWRVRGAMADWDLHTPRIEGTFAAAEGWVPAFGSSANRCSGFNSPPTVSRGSTDFLPHEYWHGTHLAIPGHGSQELLPRRAGNVLAPTNGNADPLVALYRLVTRNNWQIRCLATLKNAPGEGFVALSPDGVRYSFDWMASRSQTTLRKGAVLTRSDMYLMATSVVDRFGNEVKYTYDDANPLNLTEVKSSDGRIITLAYAAGRVSTVSDGTRTWQYLYSPQGDLQTVQLPDGSRWSFNLRPLFYDGALLLGEFTDCDSLADAPTGQFVGAITHPSGATGTFTTRFLTQGRTNVQRACTYVSGSTWTNGSVWPRSTSNQALTAKQISGPGMAAMNWAYNAGSGDPWGEWTCTSCPDRKTVTVTEPSGAVTRHTFGIRWHGNEGQLLRVEQGPVGSAALSTTDFSYRDAGGQAYADGFGDSVYLLSDWLSTRNRPQDSRVTTQQGLAFTWAVDAASEGFDTQARPLKVNKFSGLGYTKTETTTYADNTALWVIGQEASVADSYGRLMRSATYDNPATALPTAKYSFGRLLESFLYWPDGTVKQRIDPVGRITALSNYKRGLPQNVTHRDGATESAVVNNIGKVTEYTNAAGTTTKFGYDPMGRIARVDHPNEPNLQYHPTFNTFEPVPYLEHGLPAGHWRQTTTTGNAITMRWYDAMWRVRLMQSWDTTDGSNTSKMVEYRYDHEGKKTFQAYPQRAITPVDQTNVGTSWTYDALDRPVQTRQTSELPQGDLVSTTEYLPDFQRKVTDPRGASTTFQFQAFDSPSEDRIAGILAPESVWIAILRDIHGMPDSIVRGGSFAGVAQNATRSYFYDSFRRLCKTVERETGATVQGYDAAGNVAWRASGLALPAAGCEDAAAPPDRRINFDYDARDRLTATRHGDGTSVITRAYTSDGLLSNLTSARNGVNTITWAYEYYNRRLLKSERYTWGDPNNSWLFAHPVNTHGHVSGLQDPMGSIEYEPNALGQPTRAGAYAHNVRYHANGVVSDYALGSGVWHSVSLNTRGLPATWADAGVSRDDYTYDANGNVSVIADVEQGLSSRSMGYDPLNRLTETNGIWGNARYSYDGLDNLRSSIVGGRSLDHIIDPVRNRLLSLSGSQNISISYDANGNVSARGGQAFAFDLGNRLITAEGKASYAYDGHGRRNLSWFSDGTYRHDAYTQDGKMRLWWKLGQGAKRFVYLGDKLIAETTEAGVTTYSHTDALGSPVAKTNSAGAVTERTRYEPYGATVAGSTNPTGIGFTGHVNDPDTGLVYMQQRYYDPIAGRFLSVDPVTTSSSSGGKFNRYAYAENNPYKYVDPDGRDSYLVSRPLGDKSDNSRLVHNFVVSHAKFVGDPSARVFSFGKTNDGTSGRVDDKTQGMSAGTEKRDGDFWKSLSGASAKAAEMTSSIKASDDAVATTASSVKANTVYAPIPVLPGATNSNSAASAVADKSQGSAVKLPNAEGRTAVGEGARHRIEFEKK